MKPWEFTIQFRFYAAEAANLAAEIERQTEALPPKYETYAAASTETLNNAYRAVSTATSRLQEAVFQYRQAVNEVVLSEREREGNNPV